MIYYKILTLRKIVIDLFFKKRFKTEKKAIDIVIFLSVLIIVFVNINKMQRLIYEK